MFTTLIPLALWSNAAGAQEVGDELEPEVMRPSPTSQCADAASGAEVEVCLQLAAANPPHVDGISAALRAHISRASDGDRDLLLAVLALMDDASVADATQRIIALGDPRALAPLVACSERRTEAVSAHCVQAIASFPNSLGTLRAWVRETNTSEALRHQAALALGALHTEEAADILIETLRLPRVPPLLRRSMIEVIQRDYPHRLAELDGQVSTDGRAWLALGSGWGLGFSMAAAGHFGQTELEALGWATGATTGAVVGVLYANAWPMEAGDAAFISTSGILGTTSGMLISTGLGDNSDDHYLGGLGGLAAGYGTAVLLRQTHNGTALDSLEATGIATLATLGAVGAASQLTNTPQANIQPLNLVSGLALGTGTLVGHTVAPWVDLTPEDTGLLLLGTGYGAAFGALLPVDSQSPAGLALLGGSAGGLLAYGVASQTELGWDAQFASWAGGIYGGVFGSGAGLLIDSTDPKVVKGATLTGTSLGMAVGGWQAWIDPDPIDDRDAVLVGLTTGWTTWQSIGWAQYTQPTQNQVGVYLMIPPAIGAATAIVSPLVDVPAAHATAATSVGVWGAYIGGASAQIIQSNALLWSLVGSNIGLAGGGLMMSPLVGAPPLVVGLADAGGVLGGSTAALGTAFFTQNTESILIASIVGAGVGAVGGGAL
ncbi:MAG: hypothetical protein GWP91_21010, partial [Rhodobacterales bacterium]|nr:hypothetical protein [Rhodobacterales bacterium]